MTTTLYVCAALDPNFYGTVLEIATHTDKRKAIEMAYTQLLSNVPDAGINSFEKIKHHAIEQAFLYDRFPREITDRDNDSWTLTVKTVQLQLAVVE